jgi:hypothetical protein
MAQLDENKLNAFVGKMLGDLGGAFSVPTVSAARRGPAGGLAPRPVLDHHLGKEERGSREGTKGRTDPNV